MKHLYLTAIILVFVAIFTSCNIFAPLISAARTGDSAESLVEEGKKEMRNGNPSEALKYFDRAIKKDSLYSDAWYYRSKMLLRIGDVLVPMLWDEVSQKNENGVEDENKVPFFPRNTMYGIVDWPNKAIDTLNDGTVVTNADTLYNFYARLYAPAMQGFLSLKRIWDGYAPHGTIKSDIIKADYLFLSSLYTSFIICDVNLDYTLDTSYNSGNLERKAYTTFAKSFTDIKNIKLDADDIYGIYSVKDINTNIESILNSSDITLTVLNSLDNEIQNSKYSDSLDKAMLADPRKQLEDIKRQVGYYFYNDGQDNDFDWYDRNNNGRFDKMIWMDLNNDKRISLGLSDTLIADSAHFAKDSLADFFRSTPVRILPAQYPSATGNIPCVFHLATNYGYRVVGNIKYYLYCGPYAGEFVAGDYGVDEERLDNKNNDGDRNTAVDTLALKDEDTRITPDSTDEDVDYTEFSINTPMPNYGTASAPKQNASYIITWSNGYINYRSSFQDKQALQPYTSLNSSNTITDDFGNRYRIFKKFDDYRLKIVRDTIGTGFESAFTLFDTLIVRAEFSGHPLQDAIIWNDLDNDGLIDDGNGGHFSNSNTPTTCPQGEFLGGDWGVDEEVYDGCDNDGDGRIDEDGDRKWYNTDISTLNNQFGHNPIFPTYHRPCQ